MKSDIDYHRTRASRELDLGLTSASMAAARSHFRLSWLHLERSRLLEGGGVTERPPFILA